MPIDFYFKIQKCQSSNLENYPTGNIPFVSNTSLNNGVVKYVGLSEEKELIKNVPCIAINGFGFATIQTQPFIGTGNGGVYVSALIPKKEMTMLELAYYAGQLNLKSWRFSYGRRAVKHRLLAIKLSEFKKESISPNLLFNIKNTMVSEIDSFVKEVIAT